MSGQERRLGLGLVTEGVVIVISILLAFGLDAWWDGVAERASLEASLASVLEEFEANRSALPVVLESHASNISGLRAARGQLSEVGPGETAAIADTLLHLSVRWFTYDAQIGALSALLESGELAKIRDPRLRKALAGWTARIADSTESEFIRNRDFLPPYLEMLVSQVELPRLREIERTGRGQMVSRGAVELTSSKALINRMYLVERTSVSSLEEEQGLLAEMDTILSLLESELAQ